MNCDDKLSIPFGKAFQDRCVQEIEVNMKPYRKAKIERIPTADCLHQASSDNPNQLSSDWPNRISQQCNII